MPGQWGSRVCVQTSELPLTLPSASGACALTAALPRHCRKESLPLLCLRLKAVQAQGQLSLCGDYCAVIPVQKEPATPVL